MKRILVVGGESEVSRMALRHLQRAGYSASGIGKAKDALRRAREAHPPLIIVDAAALRGEALEICRSIRRLPSLSGTQLVFIATHASEEDRVLGFESGADDYLSGPFSEVEFVARIRAVLRRLDRSPLLQPPAESLSLSTPAFPTTQNSFSRRPRSTLTVGDIEINPTAMRLIVDGREVPMTALEFRLIYYLAENQPRVFTRDQLLDAVWGDSQFVTPRTVDAAIRRIRSKIEPKSSSPIYLKTVRGVGYRLDRAIINGDGFRNGTVPQACLAS